MSLKSLNFRFAALFSVLFIVCLLLLFIFTYLLLQSSLRQDQERETRARLLEFWTLYQLNGLDILTEEHFRDIDLMEWNFYLVRIANSANKTLFLYMPEYWQQVDLDQLESGDPPGEGELIRLTQEGGTLVEVTTLRLDDGNIFQIGVNIEGRIETLGRFRGIFVILVLPLILLGFAGGLLFSNRSLRPIHNLIDAIQAIIDTGKIETRIPNRDTGDELDRLVMLFNRMLEKIALLVSGLRQTLDNVAHDLRTPLTRLSGKAELVLRSGLKEGSQKSEAYRAVLTECLEEAGGILKMLNTLMDISEAETGVMRLEKELLNLSSIVEDLAELYRYSAEEKNITLQAEFPQELLLPLDLNRIRQVVANLLDNAVKYTCEGGNISIRVFREDSNAVITVSDTGIGIPENEREVIWDRLYRSDRSRSEPGLGLGLSLVKAIVSAHRGTVVVESQSGQGSRFMVYLPLL